MVGLATELEGRPFHVILSHNQRGGPDVVLAEAFQNGLGLFPGNVSVTRFAQHPGIEGTGYVPYYALFGPDGALVDHHQGGPYHGGNGTQVVDTIRERLDGMPALYLGEGSFHEYADLARAVESGEKRASALAAVEAALKATPEHAELMRMDTWISRELKREAVNAAVDATRDPKLAVKKLRAMRRELGGTRWVNGPDKLLSLLVGRAPRVPAVAGASDEQIHGAGMFRKIERRWSALRPLPGNGGAVRNPRCPEFLEQNALEIQAIRRALKELRTKYPDSVAAADSFTWLNLLDKGLDGARENGQPK